MASASEGSPDRLRRPGTKSAGPSRPDPHHVLEGGGGQRLLDGVHDLCLDRVDVSGEVVHEIVLGDPREAVVVDDEMRQRWGRGSLLQQGADRFAFVESKACDVDQANHVRRVGSECGHDLSAIRVRGDQRRPVLKAEDVAQTRYVVGEPFVRRFGTRRRRARRTAMYSQAGGPFGVGPGGGDGDAEVAASVDLLLEGERRPVIHQLQLGDGHSHV